jgi:predicted GNAT family acetyltransferase
MTDEPISTIVDNAAASRFETTVEGRTAFSEYKIRDGVMVMPHTMVPPELEGRGIAGRLVAAALAHARAQGLKVNPLCSYVATYMRRHPEVQDLHV